MSSFVFQIKTILLVYVRAGNNSQLIGKWLLYLCDVFGLILTGDLVSLHGARSTKTLGRWCPCVWKPPMCQAADRALSSWVAENQSPESTLPHCIRHVMVVSSGPHIVLFCGAVIYIHIPDCPIYCFLWPWWLNVYVKFLESWGVVSYNIFDLLQKENGALASVVQLVRTSSHGLKGCRRFGSQSG